MLFDFQDKNFQYKLLCDLKKTGERNDVHDFVHFKSYVKPCTVEGKWFEKTDVCPPRFSSPY